MPAEQIKGAIIEATTPSPWPHDGLTITLARPDVRMRRGDTLIVRSPQGDELDIMLATVRPDGVPSVWYAVNPTLRHWLGWLERRDERTYVLRMEPFHIQMLEDLRAAAEAKAG
ncbi:MAG TPA: hypothetical protein VG986_13200 [Pseudolabrys sp.]|nr:hypothetical protein [Pseudolabrys sp.]